MEYISTQTFTGYGCFVLIDRYGYCYLLLVSLLFYLPVCGMYTMLPRSTIYLICSIYSFRPVAPLLSCISCGDTMYSIDSIFFGPREQEIFPKTSPARFFEFVLALFAKKCQYKFKKLALEFLNVYHCSRKKVQKDFVWENLCENQVSTTVGDGH